MAEIRIYDACDKAIKAMNRENLKAFGKLKLAKWDQLNVIREVLEVYRKAAKKARAHYYEVAFEAYLIEAALCGVEPKKAHRMAEKAITGAWVDEILKQTDFVTLYRFNTETERKAYRLAEALSVARDKGAEIDAALKAWSRQLGQYAINVTDYAAMEALEDAGVERVMWVTQEDHRVCGECRKRNRRTFKVDEVPPKHYGCRCYLLPARTEKDDD